LLKILQIKNTNNTIGEASNN